MVSKAGFKPLSSFERPGQAKVQQGNNYIAVDLGAESGRIMLGNVTNERLVLEEIYRFPNQPLKQDKTLRWNFNNILSNIKKGIWQREGTDLSYSELTTIAKQAKAFQAYIDPDYDDFLSPGDMPAKINSYLKKTGQSPIKNKAQIVRAILENVALKYRMVLEKIEDIVGSSVDCLYMVGGGTQNELLCQFTANSTGKKVVAGPVEATASGNILMQAKAMGQVGSLKEIREIVRNSFELKEYQPEDTKSWQKQYEKVQNMLNRKEQPF